MPTTTVRCKHEPHVLILCNECDVAYRDGEMSPTCPHDVIVAETCESTIVVLDCGHEVDYTGRESRLPHPWAEHLCLFEPSRGGRPPEPSLVERVEARPRTR